MILPDRRREEAAIAARSSPLAGAAFLYCAGGCRPVRQDYSAVVILFWQLSVKYGFF